jgi:hypothetical protein
MKCPLKPIKIHKNRYNNLCNGARDSYEATIAKIETDFGECDRYNCMAYNASKGKCMMVEGNQTV